MVIFENPVPKLAKKVVSKKKQFIRMFKNFGHKKQFERLYRFKNNIF